MSKKIFFSDLPIAKEWHPTKNLDLNPNKISHGSNKKVWWKCKKNHEWQADIRYAKSECKICKISSK
tara:strand:+ start:805 stop:1005 length:201 start_codon:yes stop_codon:yes gene_type:complete